MIRYCAGLAPIAVFAMMAFGAQGRASEDVEDLVDTSASRGERELENRGYEHRKTIKIKESSIDYWWKSRGQHCIAVTTKNGRYSSIMDQPDAVCDEAGASSGGHHGGDLKDLVGMRARSGKRELEDRGYEHRKTVKVKENSIAYWWKQRGHHCIAVEIKDGRYSSVMDQPRSMCEDDEARGSIHHGSGGHEGAGSEAPPGGFSAPGGSNDSPPEIIMGSNGEGEVTFGNTRCVVYYDAKGRRKNSLPACSRDQIQRADRGMASYRREQGM